MDSPSRGALRLARASAWAAAAFGLSTGAHVVGGGSLPSPGVAALISMALLWCGLLLTQWRLGRVALTLSLGISQLLLHTVLAATETIAATCVATGSHHVVVACADGATPMPHGTSAGMVLAHTVAALLLALVLARGEDAVWHVAQLLWPRLPAAPALLLVVGHGLAPSRGGEPPRPAMVPGGAGRRGPPVRRAPAVV
ncbi:hypothetical protein [Janibacter limosus]|uniref:hypothetical protein n=1 Tax=Janibacter limosus TaxID=53458 RepID=UPI00082CE99D|nr:hypothetical protein [Janibacter limosus]